VWTVGATRLARNPAAIEALKAADIAVDVMFLLRSTDRRGHGMEVRAFSGNVLVSTGPNTQTGGPNNTQCHLDIPMRNCSLYLDDRPVVVVGDLVVEELRPAAPARV